MKKTRRLRPPSTHDDTHPFCQSISRNILWLLDETESSDILSISCEVTSSAPSPGAIRRQTLTFNRYMLKTGKRVWQDSSSSASYSYPPTEDLLRRMLRRLSSDSSGITPTTDTSRRS